MYLDSSSMCVANCVLFFSIGNRLRQKVATDRYYFSSFLMIKSTATGTQQLDSSCDVHRSQWDHSTRSPSGTISELQLYDLKIYNLRSTICKSPISDLQISDLRSRSPNLRSPISKSPISISKFPISDLDLQISDLWSRSPNLRSWSPNIRSQSPNLQSPNLQISHLDLQISDLRSPNLLYPNLWSRSPFTKISTVRCYSCTILPWISIY